MTHLSSFQIHSVESEHRGREHSSVFYIPAGPECAINRDYLRRMRHTMATGGSPPDFPRNDYEVRYRGRATPRDLSRVGRVAAGWDEEVKEEGEGEVGGSQCQGQAKDEL